MRFFDRRRDQRPLPASAMAVAIRPAPAESHRGAAAWRGASRRRRPARRSPSASARPASRARRLRRVGGTRESPRPPTPSRSTSTKIRLRELRTRCCGGASRSTRTRATGAPSGAVARSTRRRHRRQRRRAGRASSTLGADVAQVDEDRERIGLAGQVRHRLGGFDQHGADARRRAATKWTRSAGASAAPSAAPPLAASVTARAATTARPTPVEECGDCHHLTSSPPRRNLRTSRCFSSDSGSLTSWRITTACAVIAAHRAVHESVAGADRVDLAVGAGHHRDPARRGSGRCRAPTSSSITRPAMPSARRRRPAGRSRIGAAVDQAHERIAPALGA